MGDPPVLVFLFLVFTFRKDSVAISSELMQQDDMPLKIQTLPEKNYANPHLDDRFQPFERAGLTYPLGRYFPNLGEVFPLEDGIGWVRLPMPGQLDHINVWILDDDAEVDGSFALVDAGVHLQETITTWEEMLAGTLAKRQMTRMIVTHYHADHVGCAGWLAEQFNAPIWMPRSEWLTARMLHPDHRKAPPEEALARRKLYGYDEAQIKKFSEKPWGDFHEYASPLPTEYRRINEGDLIKVGQRNWRVIIGSGHSPEHACFADYDNGVLIAGDQILPRINVDVSVTHQEPDADPLGEWLTSIEKFKQVLDPDMLILPSHGEPFKGVHTRLDAMAAKYNDGLDKLAHALRDREFRVVDAFDLLFNGKADGGIFSFTAAQTMAHFRHLERTGRAICELRDGVAWYAKP